MNKTVSIVILLFMVIAMSPAAFASSGVVLTVKAEVEQATQSVSIAGTISTGAGKQVTVVVLNPSGNVDYIDQTTSGAEGAYAFLYMLDKTAAAGMYSVSVGGSGVTGQTVGSFIYSPADSSGPSDSPPTQDPPTQDPPNQDPPSQGLPPSGQVPPNRTDDEGSKQTVSAEELKKDGSGHSVILLAPGKKELLLPFDAGVIMGDGKLEIRNQSFSVSIDSADLQALSALAGTSGAKNARISFKAEPVSGPEAESLLSQSDKVHAKETGAVFRFELSVIAEDGKEYRLASFKQPVEVSLPVPVDADKDLVGVYYYNETTAAWEFIGGHIGGSGTMITAMLAHFSMYAVLEYGGTFDDIPASHWAYRAVTVLAAKQVVKGVSETRFAPGEDVTRAEFAAMLARALGLKAGTAAPFADVKGSSWSAGDIAAAYEAGLIKGRTDSLFAPEDSITREEMATMLVRAFGFAGGGDLKAEAATFADQGEVSAWAVESVNAAAENGLMNGLGGGRFAPAAQATRAETAEALLHLLQLLKQAN